MAHLGVKDENYSHICEWPVEVPPGTPEVTDIEIERGAAYIRGYNRAWAEAKLKAIEGVTTALRRDR